MKRDAARLLLVLALLVAGVVLKVARYGGQRGDANAAGVAHVTAVMAAHGWRADDETRVSGGVLGQISFHRDGCSRPVIVALLGGNAEGVEFFRRRHGGDVMLVQAGRIVAQPSGFTRQIDGLAHRLAAFAGATPQLPVLAISPAAAEAGDVAADGCRGPPRSAWSTPHETVANGPLAAAR